MKASALSFVASLALAVAPVGAEQTEWRSDDSHSKAIFKCTHDGISPVTGWFNKMTSTLKFDDKDLRKCQVSAVIMVPSLSTGNSARDQHLRSEHFFDASKYPVMLFNSKSITPSGPGRFKMTGDLRIKDVTRTVVLDCKGPVGPVVGDQEKTRLGVTATTSINRKDFGMNWNLEVSKGVLFVGDQVDITLEMEYLKPDIKAGK